MTRFTTEFKVQSVEKVQSRASHKSIKDVAISLGIGYSTLQRWVRLAKNNLLEKAIPNMLVTDTETTREKSPQDWQKEERFEAIMHCHNLNEEQVSSYCREHGIYPHHLTQWKTDFLNKKGSSDALTKREQGKLKKENKRLQKELNRKEKALAETAALLVLSKKYQAFLVGKEED